MNNFEITLREIIISLTIIGIGIAAMIFTTSKIDDSYVGKNDIYLTAGIYNDQTEFDYGLNGGTGYAFIEGDVEPVGSVTLPELKGEYVYIKRVKECYSAVTKTRTVTYSCGKNKTCTRVETYIDYEWVTKSKDYFHVDFFTINGYTIKWDDISTPWDSWMDLDGKLNSSVIEGSSGFEFQSLWGGDYFTDRGSWNNVGDIRYSYKVITFDDVEDGSIFVNFENSEMEPGESTYKVYDMTPEELSVYILKSPRGWKIFTWVAGSIITGALVFGFYYLDNRWLH